MDFNNNIGQQQYENVIKHRKNTFVDNRDKENGTTGKKQTNTEHEGQRLRQAVNEFTSILVNKMFSSMRDTVPDDKFIDGGFAEDVFTDMMDSEISKMGARQDSFASLNRLLYQQLTGTDENISSDI